MDTVSPTDFFYMLFKNGTKRARVLGRNTLLHDARGTQISHNQVRKSQPLLTTKTQAQKQTTAAQRPQQGNIVT